MLVLKAYPRRISLRFRRDDERPDGILWVCSRREDRRNANSRTTRIVRVDKTINPGYKTIPDATKTVAFLSLKAKGLGRHEFTNLLTIWATNNPWGQQLA